MHSGIPRPPECRQLHCTMAWCQYSPDTLWGSVWLAGTYIYHHSSPVSIAYGHSLQSGCASNLPHFTSINGCHSIWINSWIYFYFSHGSFNILEFLFVNCIGVVFFHHLISVYLVGSALCFFPIYGVTEEVVLCEGRGTLCAVLWSSSPIPPLCSVRLWSEKIVCSTQKSLTESQLLVKNSPWFY